MPEASLSCYPRQEGRSLVLALEGTLDLATAPQALEMFQEFLLEHGPELVMDTSRLDFIDSRGVGALLTVAKAARDAGGAIYLPRPALPVQKILEACGLTSLFPSDPPHRSEASAHDGRPGNGRPPVGRTIVGRAYVAAQTPSQEEPEREEPEQEALGQDEQEAVAVAAAAGGRAAGSRAKKSA